MQNNIAYDFKNADSVFPFTPGDTTNESHTYFIEQPPAKPRSAQAAANRKRNKAARKARRASR